MLIKREHKTSRKIDFQRVKNRKGVDVTQGQGQAHTTVLAMSLGPRANLLMADNEEHGKTGRYIHSHLHTQTIHTHVYTGSMHTTYINTPQTHTLHTQST